MSAESTAYPLAVFFALTFAITWGLEALIDPSAGLSTILLLEVAGAGPSVAGLVVAWTFGGTKGLRDLLGRALRWRVGVRWYFLVLIAFPALLVGVLAAAIVLSGQTFRTAFPGPWWLAPALLPLAFFLGPLQEEFGWRAFALPALMERRGWLSAGLLLGLVWALWHRTPSTWAEIAFSEPLGSAGVLGLILGAVVPDVALSVLMAWVFVRTRGSALLAGFGMHAAANYALFLPAAPAGPGAAAATWTITAAFAGCLAVLAFLAALSERRTTDAGTREP